MIAFAGYSSTEVGKYLISASSYTGSANCTVSERGGSTTYPTGVGYIRYTNYGTDVYKTLYGSSNKGYWSAYYGAKSGQVIIRVRTEAYGASVTAYP